MSPFEPKGETARWRLIYELLQTKQVDDILKYEEMADVLDLDPLADRHLIQVSMRRAAREFEQVDRHAVEAIANTGYRVVAAEEHLRLAKRLQRRSSKALVLGRSKVVNVDLSAVDPEVRHAFEVVAEAFNRQMEFNRRLDVRQKRLEQALESVQGQSSRTVDEVAELRARLERLENRDK